MNALAEETAIVAATAAELDAIHAALERFWARLDGAMARPPDEEWRFAFVTAVAEIAGNIVQHAYPAIPGQLHLRLRAFGDHVEACLTDQGIAFAQPLPAQSPPDGDSLLLEESGRGLAIAQAYLDTVDYRRTGEKTNEWRLVKRFRPDEHGLASAQGAT